MDKLIFKLSDEHQAKKWTNQIVQNKLNSNGKQQSKHFVHDLQCVQYENWVETTILWQTKTTETMKIQMFLG